MTTPVQLLPDPDGRDPDGGGRPWAAIVLGIGAAVLVVVLALLVPVFVGDDDESAEDVPAAAGSEDAPDLTDVQVFADLTTEHVTEEIAYDQSPPVGGDHDPAWHECGVYDEPVREENAVHSLEHGTVWLTYRPGIDPGELAELTAPLPDESIVSPYGDLPAPAVVTVWGHQLELTGPDDPRLTLFLAEYADGHTAPEPLASCVGGVTEVEDGTSGDGVEV